MQHANARWSLGAGGQLVVSPSPFLVASPESGRQRFASLHASAGRSMQLLVGILVTGLPCVSEPEIAARAVAAWSACHGFVALRMAGVLSNMPGLPDLATRERFTITQMTLAALADRPQSSN
ncbi:WHG domain-containing protein [Nannocystis sp. SCPEA4]|uniref:WHG domain-containing protein n=1 Tax=Nannocystis sp. SCPEA4 TaxID=2996787 RepID=UPI0022722C83|nr:WHG domain-containing protein [Nannocystis sp. SCPEA4]MCY1059300.1 WHG domain-containing protein [Nannocystis sp. SCPEA4]